MSGVMAGGLASVLILFLINTTLTSILMTLVYNGSLGSIPLLLIYHWLLNLHYPWELQAGIIALQDVAAFIFALILLIIFGR